MVLALGWGLSTAAAGCGGPGPRAPQGAPTTAPLGTTATSTTTTTPAPTPTLPPGSSVFLAQSVTFVSDADAWVLGAVRCDVGWCTAVRHTQDRGRNWTSVPAPPTTIDTGSEGVSRLRFADPDDGYAFGPGLWVTHDGGSTWSQQSLAGGADVLDLAAADGEVYAVACPGAPSCVGPAVLYRSPSGNDRWRPLGDAVLPLRTYSVDLQVQGHAVSLLAKGVGTVTILGSPDGSHFADLPDPCPTSGPDYWSPADLSASTPTDLAVLCAGNGAAGSEQKQVFVSSDGGHTYRQVALPPFLGDAEAIAAASPTTLVVSARSGASWLDRATGADTGWTTALTFDDGGMGVSDLGFTDATHGQLVHSPPGGLLQLAGTALPPAGLGTLYLTDDGGASWYPVAVPRG
ncbi:MAG: WD40/YVTN/BNR-like repeat-containing protein [Acidimicrobiales bacterium]